MIAEMKRHVCAILTCLLFVCVVLLVPNARSTELLDQRFTTESVIESAQWLDSNCLLWQVTVFAANNRFGRTDAPSLEIAFSLMDRCPAKWLSRGGGGSTNFFLKLTGNLASAHLQATNVVFRDDLTGESMSIDIDLHWTATGNPERLMVTGPYKAEGIRHSTVIKRELCVATVKGTLKLKTNPTLALLLGDEIELQLNESNVGYAEVQRFMDNDKIALLPLL